MSQKVQLPNPTLHFDVIRTCAVPFRLFFNLPFVLFYLCRQQSSEGHTILSSVKRLDLTETQKDD